MEAMMIPKEKKEETKIEEEDGTERNGKRKGQAVETIRSRDGGACSSVWHIDCLRCIHLSPEDKT